MLIIIIIKKLGGGGYGNVYFYLARKLIKSDDKDIYKDFYFR